MITRYRRWLYPELRHVQGRTELRQLMKLAWRQSMGNWILIIVCMTWMMIYLVTSIVIGKSLVTSTSPIFTGLIFGLVPSFTTLTIVRPKMRREMRIELRKNGLPICIHCGYDITGIDGLTCPECGKPIIDPVGS